jgi:patatin-like phospholipase/acyl hydrolase
MFSFFRQQRPARPRSAGTLYKARERLPWPADRDFRILSIDGGGIRGILPLAILARLEKTIASGDSIASRFDMVVGTSTGGIIALGLGAGKRVGDILELYMERGNEVFPDNCWLTKRALSAWHILFNRCDHKRLGQLIDEVLGDRALWQSRIRLCIPSAETRYFEPFIAKTPHHPDYKIDWTRAMAHVARATSAAPTFFKPVEGNDGYEFVDGGIWANNPIMVGVADALACFDIRREQIRVLSLGCVQNEFQMGWARRHLGGIWFWRSIMMESMHIQSQNVIGQARLIVGGDRVLRLDAPPVRPKIELWDWARCRRELPEMADRLILASLDRIWREFLSEPAEPYTPFYTPTSPPAVKPL